MNPIDAILSFAQKRPDITYVIQNGSRVNPSIVPDIYADYDIIMGSGRPQLYIDNRDWMKEFGDLLILQLNRLRADDFEWPIFLMQFKNGLRVDLQFYPGDAVAMYRSDSLSKVLLDKENRIGERFEPSEETYIARKPQEKEFLKEVNNFWWCVVNVGKGLARKELTYTRFMYESIVRENFLRIIGWYVSWKHGWHINIGKFGKFLEKYAESDIWKKVERTYFTDSPDEFWASLFNACDLIKMVDGELRKELGLEKERDDADGVIAFLRKIKEREHR